MTPMDTVTKEGLRKRPFSSLLAMFGLLLISFLFFSDFFIFGKIPFDPARGSDVARHIFPLKAMACRFLQEGYLPLWNPYILLGLPWLGDGQTFFLDPFNIPFFFLPPLDAYMVTLWLLLFSSVMSMFLLLRKFDFSDGASFVGAAVYGLNGFTVTYLTVQNAMGMLVWLPLILLCLERGMEQKRMGLFFYGGFFFGLSILSLTPTYLSGMGIVLALFIVIRMWEKRDGGILGKNTPLVGGLATLTVGILIGVVELLPMLQLTGESQRLLATGAGYFEKNFLPWTSLIGFIFPLTGQEVRWTGTAIPAISHLYLGIPGLVLALFGLLAIWQNSRCRFFGILGISGLLALLVLRFTAIRQLWHFLPILKEINLFKFLLSFYPLCAGVWVAQGYTMWRTSTRPNLFMSRLIRLLVTLHVLIFIGVMLYQWISPALEPVLRQRLFPQLAERLAGHGIHPFSQAFYEEKMLFLYRFLRSPGFLWTIIVLGTIRLLSLRTLGQTGKLKKGIVTAFMIFLPLDPVMTWRILLPFSSEARHLYRKTNEVALLKSLLKPGERAAVFESRDWSIDPQALASLEKGEVSFQEVRSAYREDEVHWREKSLLSNILLTFQIPDVGGKQSLFLGRTLRYLDAVDQKIDWRQGRHHQLRHEVRFQGEPKDRLLDLLGMKYLLSRYPLQQRNVRLLMDQREGDRNYYLYENQDAFPRVYLVSHSEVFSDSERLMARLKDTSFDPRTAVLFEEEVSSFEEKRGFSETQGKAEIIAYTPNRVEVETVCNRPSYLLLTDSYYPGWKAMVDGKETKIYRANFLFRAILLPAGTHRVIFAYDPKAPKMGASISGVMVLSLCVGTFWTQFAKRRRDRRSQGREPLT